MAMANWALLVAALGVAGCNGGGDRAERAADTGGMMGHMDSGGMGMAGMPMPGMQMMPQMRAHMDSMMRMSPQQMQAMMAMHESMMSQMMDGMGSDMRGMKMSGTPTWTALTDSVKQDLAELPNLKGPERASNFSLDVEEVSIREAVRGWIGKIRSGDLEILGIHRIADDEHGCDLAFHHHGCRRWMLRACERARQLILGGTLRRLDGDEARIDRVLDRRR